MLVARDTLTHRLTALARGPCVTNSVVRSLGIAAETYTNNYKLVQWCYIVEFNRNTQKRGKIFSITSSMTNVNYFYRGRLIRFD